MTEASREVCVEKLIDEIAMGPFGSNIKADCFVDSGVPVFNGSNLVGFETNDNTLRFVTQEKAKSLGNALASRGDVVVTHRGTLGQIAMIPYDSRYPHYVISQSQFRVRCNNKVLPKFLVYYFHTREGQWRLLSNKTQTGVPALGRPTSTFRKLSMPLPAIETQAKIVQVLDAMQEKIEANAKLNGYLEELARAMYVGVMQEHANTAPLCDMAELNSETYSPKENWSAVCYIDTSALMLNNLAELQHFNPTEEKLPTRARRKVANGDILYSTVRPNQNHYGLLYNPMPHTLASTAFAVIRPSDITMSPLVYLALTDVGITEALQQLAETSTSTIPSIRPVDLEQIAVLVPSDEYGNEIAAQIEAAFKQIDCNKRENRELAILRDTLLPKLMSGEIDVSEIDPTQLNSHLA